MSEFRAVDVVGLLGNTSYAIKGLNKSDITDALGMVNLVDRPLQTAFTKYFDWCFNNCRIDQGARFSELKIMISPKVEDWHYLYCSLNNPTDEFNVIEILNRKGATIACSYYVDGHLGSCCWVLSENGKVYRHFSTNQNGIEVNKGIPLIKKEQDLVKYLCGNGDFVFDEEVLIEIMEKTGNHMSNAVRNESLLLNSNFTIGSVFLKL